MEAIIAGAGIAGPVAAIALRRIGIDSEVLETRDTARADNGLFLTLAANGIRVLADLSLDAAIRAGPHIPTPRIAFLGADGRQIGTVTNGRCSMGEPITLMRQSLHASLSTAAEEQGVAIRRGVAVSDYRQDAHGVTVICDDGSERRAGLLIGADGIGSKVRAALPSGDGKPAYAGLLNLGGIAPQCGLEATKGEMRMIWGRRAFFGYIVNDDGDAWWFANIAAQEPVRGGPRRDRDAWADRLATLFADDLPLINSLICRTPALDA